MTEAEAIEAIYQQWKTGWEAIHGRDADTYPDVSDDIAVVPYVYDNEAYDKDDLGALGAWCRVTVQLSTRQQVTMGSAPYRKFENRGRVFVQIFTPSDAGRALRARLADDVRTVLEGQRLGELLLHDAVTRGENWFSTGPSRDGAKWSTSVVVVEMRFTDTR